MPCKGIGNVEMWKCKIEKNMEMVGKISERFDVKDEDFRSN